MKNWSFGPDFKWIEVITTAVLSAAVVLFVSFVLFLVNIVVSNRSGDIAGDNPWDAGTLEWATSSPPPPYNFARMPFVTSHEPLWLERESLPVVSGMSVEQREVIVSSVTEARPELREQTPDPSIWPFLAAVAVGIAFIASIFSPYAVLWGSALVAVTIVGWFWPKSAKEDE